MTHIAVSSLVSIVVYHDPYMSCLTENPPVEDILDIYLEYNGPCDAGGTLEASRDAALRQQMVGRLQSAGLCNGGGSGEQYDPYSFCDSSLYEVNCASLQDLAVTGARRRRRQAANDESVTIQITGTSQDP